MPNQVSCLDDPSDGTKHEWMTLKEVDPFVSSECAEPVDFVKAVRYRNTLTPALTELAYTMASVANRCHY